MKRKTKIDIDDLIQRAVKPLPSEYVSTEKRVKGYFWRSQWEEDSFLMRGDSTNE